MFVVLNVLYTLSGERFVQEEHQASHSQTEQTELQRQGPGCRTLRILAENRKISQKESQHSPSQKVIKGEYQNLTRESHQNWLFLSFYTDDKQHGAKSGAHNDFFSSIYFSFLSTRIKGTGTWLQNRLEVVLLDRFRKEDGPPAISFFFIYFYYYIKLICCY